MQRGQNNVLLETVMISNIFQVTSLWSAKSVSELRSKGCRRPDYQWEGKNSGLVASAESLNNTRNVVATALLVRVQCLMKGRGTKFKMDYPLDDPEVKYEKKNNYALSLWQKLQGK